MSKIVGKNQIINNYYKRAMEPNNSDRREYGNYFMQLTLVSNFLLNL